MSLRQQNLGSIIKPGFNPLGTQTPTYVYNLFAWGDNSAGQLGQSNLTPYSSPKQVGLLTNWSQVTAGYSGAMLALKTDGTLWSWGLNTSGQLGLGNITYYSSPKQIGALATWKTVSIYLYTAMGLN